MATIVNNPPSSDNSGGPLTMVIVLIIVLVIGYLGVVYVLPLVRGAQDGGTPAVNIPDEIDVNINQGGGE